MTLKAKIICILIASIIIAFCVLIMMLKYKSRKIKKIEHEKKEKEEIEKAKRAIYEKVQKINNANNSSAFSNCLDILRKHTKKWKDGKRTVFSGLWNKRRKSLNRVQFGNGYNFNAIPTFQEHRSLYWFTQRIKKRLYKNKKLLYSQI